MNKAVLLSGSNTGDLSRNMECALTMMAQYAGDIKNKSFIYETEAWGKIDQPAYYNQVIELNTYLDAHTLMQKLLQIEKMMGRERTEKWAPRLIDLDILYFNNEVINEPDLKIPHPHLHERRFTLAPLSEILPDMLHPILNRSNKDLLDSLTDTLKVRVLNSQSDVKQ